MIPAAIRSAMTPVVRARRDLPKDGLRAGDLCDADVCTDCDVPHLIVWFDGGRDRYGGVRDFAPVNAAARAVLRKVRP